MERVIKSRVLAERTARKAGKGFTVAQTNDGYHVKAPEGPKESPANDADDYEKLAPFKGRILQIGFGSVGQAMLPLLLRHIDMDPGDITVLEMDDKSEEFERELGATGVKYVVEQIVKDNLDSALSEYVEEGGLVIDLACNIDTTAIVKWCQKHGVMYINTSIEVWEDKPDEAIPELWKRTLWESHDRLRAACGKKDGPTCVLTHGANPGLVSHFVKAALLDIAKAMDLDADVPATREEWAALMEATGTKVVHIAERDTQIIDRPKQVGEFVCSWSCEGFWAEGRAPAEMGWGTHEGDAPQGGQVQPEDPRAAFLHQPGVATLIKSWVPLGGYYAGFLVQHSEAITISQYFSVKAGEKVTYSPTCHYVYQPIDAAIASVHEFRGKEALDLQDARRIAKDEIISGIDELGVLLLGHGKTAWWYGSQLGIDEARRLIPGENATSLQVVASMLGAIVWAIRNPEEGYVEPEDLPFDEVLRVARPYLGPVASVQGDWMPTRDVSVLFTKPVDTEHPWRFENFRVGPAPEESHEPPAPKAEAKPEPVAAAPPPEEPPAPAVDVAGLRKRLATLKALKGCLVS